MTRKIILGLFVVLILFLAVGVVATPVVATDEAIVTTPTPRPGPQPPHPNPTPFPQPFPPRR